MDLQRGVVFDDGDLKADESVPVPEERLDSGLDSLKEEEYREVAAELRELQLGEENPQRPGEPPDWQNQVTEDGDTWLHLAIIHEAKDCIRTTITQSRNTQFLNRQNHQRQSPLHLAVVTNQPDVCQQLLAAGCDPTLVDYNGDTPLHIACYYGNLLCFCVLTQNSQSADLKAAMAAYNYRGLNCLHLASVHGFLSLVENLVVLGADVNAQEQCNGRSALHLAVDQQNLSLVQLLLKNGADPNHVTYGGHSAFHLTYGRQNVEIQKELYPLTRAELRELPDSESDDTEEEEEAESEEEVCYDDIQWNRH
ncbi:nuclear factor of kappa light polypeptide gene enhancer in B-cells inhibitor, alpha b [Thalassophryne amazonica]|uniref:nuclear factor of kappa light polypeptide gene enhancer in B-cells inhibitor, alpha b n=1 Tax=Thalassophryne amazonica TaxID=390379 RepID=UPI0014718621|nr:nuclear factor of kappa light polypeptide gene enhancer in B-cells inhibitor, alpha b [Thalassophryne amazonica]